MPEAIIFITTLITFIIAYITLSKRMLIGILFLTISIVLMSWEIIAHKNHEFEYEKTYKIQSVGNNSNIIQITITENKLINVTKTIKKIVDIKKCKLLMSKYKDFSYGLYMMGEEYKYSIVCKND